MNSAKGKAKSAESFSLCAIHHGIRYLGGRGISFHSDVSNLCFCSDLALGDALPPPHSTFVSLRWLRFPPKLNPAKTKGLRQAVARNTPTPEKPMLSYSPRAKGGSIAELYDR
jgi:hypothetical protein